ncbi:MAG: hypothetical protein JSW11_18580 [Candidatus Heimdallarchaeota archaeon]|nr:MAG: hypothetical protein JSW11_18580 [Candidatus Heimdallarchaeota archaeon]
MEDEQLSAVVAREVEKALKTEHKEVSGSFKVLGILTHMGKGIDKLFESLIQLSREEIPVLIWTLEEIDFLLQISVRCASMPSMKVIIGERNSFILTDFIDLEYIIFGAFSFEIADKLIQFQDEDPIVNVLIQGLLYNVPVYILTPFNLMDLVSEYKPLSKINQELRKRLSLLVKIGFGVLDENDLKERFLKSPPRIPDLITETYIKTLDGKTLELRVPRTAIVTPLAREKARDLGIRIVRI